MGNEQRYLHSYPLTLHKPLPVLFVESPLPLVESIQTIHLSYHTAEQSHRPEAIRLPLQHFGPSTLPHAQRIQKGREVKRQVSGVAELPPDSRVSQDGVHRLRVGGDGRGLEVFDVLPRAHDLADEPKLFLQGLPWRNLGGGAVGAEEVPGVEAGKVLDCAEEFVATDGGGEEFYVVSHRRVVDEGVGHHDDEFNPGEQLAWC